MDDHYLFLCGAYKGNPGKVGGRGVILIPGGPIELRFAWGLGNETNNIAEALDLWQGLNLAIKRNLLSISVFGDSRLITQAMNSQNIPSQVQLAPILKKIRLLFPKFHKISFYHVLRKLNSQADLAGNLGSLRSRRSLLVNDVESKCSIP